MRDFRQALLVVLILTAWSGAAWSGATAYTGTDNENNAGTGVADGDMDVSIGNANALHPIEFNINVVNPPTTSAIITIRALDVDEEQGEQDDVYLNGVFLGSLSGANNVWNATAFTIDLGAHPGLIVAGNNRVTIQVDTSGDPTNWVTTVDWGQLLLDGGARDRGRTETVQVTGYSIAGPTVTINTLTSVTSITGGNYRIEVSVIDPTGHTGSVLTQDFTAAANEPISIPLSPTYPLNGISGTYTIQAQLFFIDNGFPVQQDIATARFVHTQNVGPTDSDNDGVTNTDELTLGTDPFNPDSDGDGIPDGTEVGANPASPTDTDNDGIPDVVESATADRDGDGIPNQADADSDNDGIPDGVEAGPGPGQRDTDGDGTPDYLDRDSDNDGIPDAREAGAEPAVPADTDGDGIPNYRDLDSDADGLPDRLEGGVTGVDTDGDGIDNAFDVNTLGGTDLNNDGVDDSVFPVSTDPDGVPDYLDTDSDNDGILDTREGNVTGTDTDSDGIDDALDVNLTGGPDANGDGIDDSYAFPDTDGDGVPDFRDLDSDDDGLFDVTEGGRADADVDGLLDAGQPAGSSVTDTDGDTVPDFRDLDSDADGTNDVVEAGYGALDLNGDGRIDAGPDADLDGIRDSRDNSPNAFGSPADGDNDGVPDALDLDLDNDGIPNSADGSDDTDGDGLPNQSDPDSDGDGLLDVYEAGGLDPDGDGLLEPFVDVNGNGLADSVEPALGGTALPLPDTDNDGIDDHRDLDSDNDGIADAVERGPGPGARDSDGDGTPDHLDLDSDGDGLSDLLEGTDDSDGDGTPDYLDQPGELVSAISGVGSADYWVLMVLGGALLWRRRREVAVLAIAAGAATAVPVANAADAPASERWYLGADYAATRLEPEDRGGGYTVDDKSSAGFRLLAGYVLDDRWSVEAFYIDAGEAGIASQNPAIGHLGELEYVLYGAGLEWAPLKQGRYRTLHPVLKVGIVGTDNSATSPAINYNQKHSWGLYFGVGGAWRFAEQWRAQAEIVSYDKDELVMSLGVRRAFR